MQKKIAFFDSGVGGLSVMYLAQKYLPHEDFIYFGDSDNAPYGIRSAEEIHLLVNGAAGFLEQFNLKALVLACNTATSVAVQQLRTRFSFPVIGMEPALKLAVEEENAQQVLVCATDLTLREHKLNSLVQKLGAENQVTLLSLQKLVSFAENFDFRNAAVDAYLQAQFQNVAWDSITSVVLGCTHFVYFRQAIEKFLPAHVHILDGNEGTVRHLISQITPNNGGNGSERYFISGREADPSDFQKFRRYLQENS